MKVGLKLQLLKTGSTQALRSFMLALRHLVKEKILPLSAFLFFVPFDLT